MKKLSERKKKWIERTVANDRGYKRFLYNRFFLFMLLVLLQMLGFAYLLHLLAYDSRIAVAVQGAVGVLSLICVLYVLNRNSPTSKLQWVIVILLAPVFGVPFYLLCGEGRPTFGMRKKLRRAKQENAAKVEELFVENSSVRPKNRAQGIEKYLQKNGFPAFMGEIEYYDSGEGLFSAIKEALNGAENFILVEYFIIAHGKMWGEMLEILLKKAEQGVQIRILYDDFGCMTTLPPSYDKYLASLHENIRALAFNKVVPLFAVRMNNRDHRKILVVDGKVAFTGGVNLADEYIGEKRRFGHWKDSGVRVRGVGVRSFTKAFFDLWNAFYPKKEDIGRYIPPVNAYTVPSNEKNVGMIQPYDDCPLDRKNVAEWVYNDVVDRATKYVYIFTPYLLLGEGLRGALCRAAERGVDVRIVTPGIPDKKLIYRLTRANYGVLLSAGVKIYEYTGGFIHSKSIVSDDECAVVGSVNFDYRSLYLHFENGVYFTEKSAVLAVKRDGEETFSLSEEKTKENCKRGLIGRMIDSLLRVFETLL